MKQSCDYHPTQIAHWGCSECDAKLCPECVVKRDKGGFSKGELLHFCPKCNAPAEWCGVENIIDPFWKRLPKIFAYPFSSIHPIILILIAALLTSLFSGPGLFKMLLRGGLLLIVLKYSFETLKSTASGDLRPPKISPKTISDDIIQVVKQYVLYFIIYALSVWIVTTVSPIIGILFFLVTLFFTPAMIILLVTTSSILHALNPLIFVRLVYRIGWGYLTMYLFLFLLGGAPAVAGQFIVNWLPEALHIFSFNAAQSFYTIISYHLMGYVILQYHDEIGYKVEQEDFKEQTERESEGVQTDAGVVILKEINPLIQDGKYDEAIAVIQKLTHGADIENVELSSRYYNLTKMTKRTSAMLACAVNHLDLLVKEKQKDDALKVYSECMDADPAFMPTANALFSIGDWMNQAGKAERSIKIYNRIVKEYPDNPMVLKSYFRAAQIFNDRLMKPEKAKKILNGLIKKYPEHEMLPQIENYLASMQ